MNVNEFKANEMAINGILVFEQYDVDQIIWEKMKQLGLYMFEIWTLKLVDLRTRMIIYLIALLKQEIMQTFQRLIN